MIQASEEEIYNYLNFIEAYQIDGKIYLLRKFFIFNRSMINLSSNRLLETARP
jgi:hypothetical protein